MHSSDSLTNGGEPGEPDEPRRFYSRERGEPGEQAAQPRSVALRMQRF